MNRPGIPPQDAGLADASRGFPGSDLAVLKAMLRLADEDLARHAVDALLGAALAAPGDTAAAVLTALSRAIRDCTTEHILAAGIRYYVLGDVAAAAGLFRERVASEVRHLAAFNDRQRAASRRRRTDGLQGALLNILSDNQTACRADVLKALRAIAGAGAVEYVNDDDGVIEWTDARRGPRETKISALSSRLCRARKILAITG